MEHVSTEMSLHVLAYNLKSVIAILVDQDDEGDEIDGGVSLVKPLNDHSNDLGALAAPPTDRLLLATPPRSGHCRFRVIVYTRPQCL